MVSARREIALDRVRLVAGNRLFNPEAILQPSDPQPSLRDNHFVALHAAGLADPQAVATHHEPEQMVTHVMPTGLRSIEEGSGLGLRWKVLAAVVSDSPQHAHHV